MDIDTDRGSASSSSPPAAQSNADKLLQKALDRVGSDAIGKSTYIEFGDAQRLAALAAEDKSSWLSLTYMGAVPLQSGPDVAEQLALDLAAADYAISAGIAPAVVTLLAGGQNRDEVKSAAESLGYKGSGVLSQKMDLKNKVTVSVAHILPKDDDVAFGSTNADMALVDPTGDSLLDVPAIAAVSGCLGDVVAAFIVDIGTDGRMVAVDVNEDDGKVTSTMCVKTDDDAAAKGLEGKVKSDLASGTTANSKKYADYFEGSSVKVLSNGVVQAKMPHASDTKPHTIFQMVTQVDLPGF